MSTPTHKSYKLTTLDDVFRKVPADRIPACLAELGALMQSTKSTVDLMRAGLELLAQQSGTTTPVGIDAAFQLTYPLTWNDDGKGDLETRFTDLDTGDPLFTLKIGRKADAA